MNTKRIHPYLFLLLAFVLAACSAPAPTPTVTPVDPATIAQDFWDAVIAKNFDTAMSYMADDVEVWGGPNGSYNKDGFSTLLSSVAETVTYEISNIQVVSGDTATYNGKVYENSIMQASGYNREVQVKDGKIAFIELP